MVSCEQRQSGQGSGEGTYRPRSVSSLLMRFKAILCAKCGLEREERLECGVGRVFAGSRGWSWRGKSEVAKRQAASGDGVKKCDGVEGSGSGLWRIDHQP